MKLKDFDIVRENGLKFTVLYFQQKLMFINYLLFCILSLMKPFISIRGEIASVCIVLICILPV